MEKHLNIPKLRFPQFQGEWEKKKMGEILSIGSGKDYKHLGEGSIPVFGTGGLMTTVSDFLYEGETVCIGRKGTIDKPMYYNGKIWTVDTLFYTHSFKKAIPKFVYNLFQRVNWKQHNEAGGVPSLSKSTIEQIFFKLPTLAEQTRIAQFFTAIDKKITQLKEKKNLLEQYKKGVMQSIFSQEIRFKDDNGKEFSKWERKKLGEIGKFYAGGDLDKLDYIKVKDEKYIFPIYANGAGEGIYGYATSFHYNSNCVTVSGRGNLGNAKHRTEKFNAIVRLIVIEPKEYINPKFLEEIINNTKFAIESTGVPQLTVPQIISYKIFTPCLSEQTKIANFLSAIDEKINHCHKQIEKTEQWKKGLLQKMFC
jgi:type I restriction enzyme S subunit